jgi:hypothetical protein
MIDRLFGEVYGLAYEFGMMLTILSNGSPAVEPKNPRSPHVATAVSDHAERLRRHRRKL